MDEFDINFLDAQRYAEDMADIDAMMYGNDEDLDISSFRD